MWLNLRAGKVKRILRSDWLPEQARWADLARSGFPALVPQEKKFIFWPYNKSLIDQAFSVEMAEYWLRSFLRFYWPRRNLAIIQYLTLGKYRMYDRNQLVILPSDFWQKRKISSYTRTYTITLPESIETTVKSHLWVWKKGHTYICMNVGGFDHSNAIIIIIRRKFFSQMAYITQCGFQ